MRKTNTNTVSHGKEKNEGGFSLIENCISLVVLMVAVLGVFSAFAYSTKFNSGNSHRSQALSVLQKEVESLRSAKFTPSMTDNFAIVDPDDGRRDITGGVKTARNVTAVDGTIYRVATTIDDDPFTTGVQTDATKSMKEISIVVTPQSTSGTWETASSTRAVFRRVRSN
jgi:Tfp pilus assembly protein PilV